MSVDIKLPDLSAIKRYAAYHQGVIDLAKCVDQIGDLERAIREADNRLAEKRKEEATLDAKITAANAAHAEGAAHKLKGIKDADEIVAKARAEATSIFAKTKQECDGLRAKTHEDNGVSITAARASIASIEREKAAKQAELEELHHAVEEKHAEHEEVKGKIETLKASAQHIVRGL